MKTIIRRYLHVLYLLLCLSLMAGCAGTTAGIAAGTAESPSSAPTTGAAWTSQPQSSIKLGQGAVAEKCQFDQGGEANNQLQCGYLLVPEDRQHPTGKQIKLHFTVFKNSDKDTLADPVLLLGDMGYFGRGFFSRDTVTHRDVVMMNQRGSEGAEPALDCPTMSDVFSAIIAQDPYSPETTSSLTAAHRQCHDKLANSGINLDAYTTAASAADYEDLRAALGYVQWNIYSSGSGARLALTLVSKYPQSIRSVVLDSAVPPQVNTDIGKAGYAQDALELMFQRCSEDSQCQGAFPNLKSVFYEVVDQLNQKPVMVKASNLSTGNSFTVWMDGYRLIDMSLQILDGANQYALPQLPRTIYQIKNGKTDQLSTFLGEMSDYGQRDLGLEELIYCNEDLLTVTADQINQSNMNAERHLADFYSKGLDQAYQICSIWSASGASSSGGVGASGTKEAAASDVPVLFLAGDFAINAPAVWSKEAAKTLSHSYYVEFAGAGSPVMASAWSDCAQQIANDFVTAPQKQPDPSCASAKKSLLWVTLP